MAPLKFLQQLKNFKVKRKASFFDPAKKTAVNLKFGLIALLPFLFLFYNHMRKTKKTRAAFMSLKFTSGKSKRADRGGATNRVFR